LLLGKGGTRYWIQDTGYWILVTGYKYTRYVQAKTGRAI
jgi:hypothetical protein